VAVADHATARHRRMAADMDDDVKAAIDEIANSLRGRPVPFKRLQPDSKEKR